MAKGNTRYSSPLIMGQRMAAALEFPPARFTGVHLAGSNVTLAASGLARSSCRLLTATNLALPLAQWSAVTTNTFDGGGGVIFTDAATPEAALRFYAIAAD